MQEPKLSDVPLKETCHDRGLDCCEVKRDMVRTAWDVRMQNVMFDWHQRGQKAAPEHIQRTTTAAPNQSRTGSWFPPAYDLS